MKLVLIHGRAQQNLDREILKSKWISALKSGLEKNDLLLPDGLDIGFPYYGDLLDNLVQNLPSDSKAISRGDLVSINDKERDFFYDLLSEVAEKSSISDLKIDQNFEGFEKEKGPLNWEWIQAILRTLDQNTPFGDSSLKQFTKDVFYYLTISNIRKQINDCVRAEINSSPCVVVGHSLGSVVGYNVLRNLQGLDVRKYITVGSPLGLKAIRSKLEVPIMMPLCIANGWYNAYDERDVVALQPLNERHFNIDPSISNSNGVKNFTNNRHGIEGYLSDKDVAMEIYKSLF
ncbi:hypothetical protein [Pedobacter heparinus]|uniref:hypothetical protein n=1 Tax=Pedobacter heparinus TaxID=984 RepID=UPI00292D61BB|nr:hypothetical protein [Pedobacter heparinus]